MSRPTSEETRCPVCENVNVSTFLEIASPEILGTSLPHRLVIVECQTCKHLFNELTDSEYQMILKHYVEEYTEFNLNRQDSTTDLPGSTLSMTLNRHKQTSVYLLEHVSKDSTILDLGCAAGGFSEFLTRNGFTNLFGIDISDKYLEVAKRNNPEVVFKEGTTENIPFTDSFFDVVVIDQVLEHLHKPLVAIEEISRVLKNHGKVIVGVPNLSKYSEANFFHNYWFLLKEHLQHFTISTLNHLFFRKDFSLLTYKQVSTPMLGPHAALPNLIVVFEKSKSRIYGPISFPEDTHFNLQEYRTLQKVEWGQLESTINKVVASKKPIYCWGISRELQYLLGNTALAKVNIVELIDSNPIKIHRANSSDANINAVAPHEFGDESLDSVMIITAIGHSSIIRKTALKLGFRGEFIILDSSRILR